MPPAALREHMDTFTRIISKMNQAIGRIVAPIILLIMIFVMWEVLGRYIFNAPTTWSNEVNQYLQCALVMLGAGFTLANYAHTRVDIVHSRLSQRARARVEVLTGVLVLVFAIPMTYYGSIIAWEAFESGETSVSAAQIVLWPSQVVVPIGAVLLAVQGLANAAVALRHLRGGHAEQGGAA